MGIDKGDSFVPNVRNFRQAASMSIRQLAMATGVDRTKISRWERGQGTRMIREAVLVALALNTTVEELFTEAVDGLVPDEFEDNDDDL